MKYIIISLLSISLVSCDPAAWNKVLEQAGTYGTPTEAEVARGLKQALEFGFNKGVTTVSKTDGFFKNAVIKILWPPEAKKVENTLRNIGMNKLCDDVILSINRGAEKAAAKAKPIFINAVRNMTINDAMNILLSGNSLAATDYLKRTTTASLRSAFKPTIKSSLDQVNATKYWSDAVNAYNKIPLVQKVNPDLAGYVTEKALDGLFHMVGKEEQRIRRDPVARTTELLKKVFNYADSRK